MKILVNRDKKTDGYTIPALEAECLTNKKKKTKSLWLAQLFVLLNKKPS